jgi:hypothetical protein
VGRINRCADILKSSVEFEDDIPVADMLWTTISFCHFEIDATHILRVSRGILFEISL